MAEWTPERHAAAKAIINKFKTGTTGEGHVCSNCGQAVKVPFGYEWCDGEWCGHCCSRFIEAVSGYFPDALAEIERLQGELAEARAACAAVAEAWDHEDVMAMLPGTLEAFSKCRAVAAKGGTEGSKSDGIHDANG